MITREFKEFTTGTLLSMPKQCQDTSHPLGRKTSKKKRKTVLIMPIISSLQVSLLSPSGKGKCGKKGKSKLPPAPFRLTDKEMKQADQRALSICVPVNYGWKPAPIFSSKSYKKSHDLKQVTAGLKYRSLFHRSSDYNYRSPYDTDK